MSPATPTLGDRFAQAESLDDFIARAMRLQTMWRAMRRHARVPDAPVERAHRLVHARRLLVLLEDWCGDAVNTVPTIAALADAAPALTLRVLERDRHPALMDARLTAGSRSIPVVIVLDERFAELGWWGPRPAALQQWATSPAARALPPAERYQHIRRWYARDRGASTLAELMPLLERPSTTAATRAAQWRVCLT